MQKTNMVKTVIMLWCKTDSGTHPNGSMKTYGLGDLLRGTIYLHQMSVEFGFEFIVDTSLHPISQYLIMNTHDHKEYVSANLNKIQIINCDEPDKFKPLYDASLQCSEPLLICTNMFCNDELSTDCKHFMQKLLVPNAPFKQYINQQNALYQISSTYSIMHIRLGDDEFFRNKAGNASNTRNINQAIQVINKYIEPSDILMSNSFRLKQQLKLLNSNIPMFNTRPLHLGELSTMFRENIAESLRETLYEFIILMNASKIKTYSVYEWVSGFVKFAALIYDIPLVDLKRQPFIPRKESHVVIVSVSASSMMFPNRSTNTTNQPNQTQTNTTIATTVTTATTQTTQTNQTNQINQINQIKQPTIPHLNISESTPINPINILDDLIQTKPRVKFNNSNNESYNANAFNTSNQTKNMTFGLKF
jgi:hypothetical protein